MTKHQPYDKDLDYQEASLLLFPEIVERHATVHIKWTCPECGERVTSDDPLTLHPQTGQIQWRPGYCHTERDDGSPCGTMVSVYTWRFGCLLIYPMGGPPLTPTPDFIRTAKGN